MNGKEVAHLSESTSLYPEQPDILDIEKRPHNWDRN